MNAAVPRSRAIAGLALEPAPLPPLVLGVSLVGPALDLLGLAQHVAALEAPALLACGLACVVQAGWLAHRPAPAWLAAALATGASVLLRLAGAPEAPALALLGLVALGIGGVRPSADAAFDQKVMEVL